MTRTCTLPVEAQASTDATQEGAPKGIEGGQRRYDVITLFPEMFAALTGSGITRRAIDRGLYAMG
ncbi:MAG: hypothetical protein RBT67_15435, partial [Thauera sp.]|nr:hypothetical protein [Thauera sp.]